jgi:hypothetical protein
VSTDLDRFADHANYRFNILIYQHFTLLVTKSYTKSREARDFREISEDFAGLTGETRPSTFDILIT